MDVRNIRLKIAYDGTGFAGWQTQPGLPTIQESIEIAIEKMTGQRPKLIGSGRTDAGVHAHAQVATFYTTARYSPDKFQNAINAFLPPEIRVINADEVPVTFHPTLDVISKRYRYRIDNCRTADPLKLRHCHHIPTPLDDDKMRRGASFLVGRHDFAAFQTVGSERLSTVRTIFACDVFRHADEVHIEVEADGFLYNMVRSIAGTLILVGSGKWSAADLRAALEARDRARCGMVAPPDGLYLMQVDYPEK